MSLLEFLLLLVALLGLVGIVVPVMPGTSLVLVATVVWGVLVGTTTGWVVVAVAVVLLGAGTLAKYLLPGRRLQAAGVPGSTLLLGGVAGLLGMVLVPVVGLVLGFVAGIYLAERRRLGAAAARPSTGHALRAVGVSILIELAAATLAMLTWAIGILLAPAA